MKPTTTNRLLDLERCAILAQEKGLISQTRLAELLGESLHDLITTDIIERKKAAWKKMSEQRLSKRLQKKEVHSMEFREELIVLVNRYSLENGSNTPDYILADYLIACLRVFDETVNTRSVWYDKAQNQPSKVSNHKGARE